MPVFAPLRKYQTVAHAVLDVTLILVLYGHALLEEMDAPVMPNAAAEHVVLMGHVHEYTVLTECAHENFCAFN